MTRSAVGSAWVPAPLPVRMLLKVQRRRSPRRSPRSVVSRTFSGGGECGRPDLENAIQAGECEAAAVLVPSGDEPDRAADLAQTTQCHDRGGDGIVVERRETIEPQGQDGGAGAKRLVGGGGGLRS